MLKKYNPITVFIASCLVIGVMLHRPPAVGAAELMMPFLPGEKLIFELRWERISAGKAVLEVLPVERYDGVEAYHFVLTARTNKFLDNIYKVRDRMDAWVNIEMNHSLHFKLKQREGGYKKEAAIVFNWPDKRAHYERPGKKRKTITLMPGTFDPLAAFYFTRTQYLATTNQLERPITDGKKNIVGICHIRKRETIEVGGKSYDTYLLEPDLKDVGGVFKKSKNAKIQVWITADEQRIPLRIKSKVAVGSFIGELVAVENVRLTPRGSESSQVSR